MIHKEALQWTPLYGPYQKSLEGLVCFTSLCGVGGGVALRINTTAAAADTDNPRTGRKLIERERESHRDTDTASEVHARYVSHPTSRVAAVDVLQNIHCLTENTFNLHTRPNTGLKKHAFGVVFAC